MSIKKIVLLTVMKIFCIFSCYSNGLNAAQIPNIKGVWSVLNDREANITVVDWNESGISRAIIVDKLRINYIEFKVHHMYESKDLFVLSSTVDINWAPLTNEVNVSILMINNLTKIMTLRLLPDPDCLDLSTKQVLKCNMLIEKLWDNKLMAVKLLSMEYKDILLTR